MASPSFSSVLDLLMSRVIVLIRIRLRAKSTTHYRSRKVERIALGKQEGNFVTFNVSPYFNLIRLF